VAWNFALDRPVYAQLIEQMELSILSGQYPPGSRLPSVRDLSAEAGVNPNTMQRALAELERDGLISTQRTSGKFITEDTAMIEGIKQKLADDQIAKFLEKMKSLGYSPDEVIVLMQREEKGGN